VTNRILFGVILTAAATASVEVYSNVDWLSQERDRKAPVDWGSGPGKGISTARPNYILGKTPPKPAGAAPLASKPAGAAPLAQIPNGGGNGLGYFSAPVPWPIIPIHTALLPDGRVMSWGTDQQGNQGGQFVYDIWNPALGTDWSAHTVLPNTTATDVFCSTASLLNNGAYTSGRLMIAGGDATIANVRNYSNGKVELFSPASNTLSSSGQMAYPRWYPAVTSLANGDKLLIGGRPFPGQLEPFPEVYNVNTGWRTLTGVSIEDYWVEWFYPRAFVGYDNAVYRLKNDGKILRIDTSAAGSVSDTGARLSGGGAYYPTLMLDSYKVLTVRQANIVQLADLSSNPPNVQNLPSLSQDRVWANATLLADGEVLITGGSGVDNQLINVAYRAEILNPQTGQWRLDASAQIPRLYHSSALLLPDGSVLVGGGGAPGPVNELNAEIYYPYYLYMNDGSGRPAPRPTIVSAPTSLHSGQQFTITVGANDKISYINLIRMGMSTHSYNADQLRIPLAFTQTGTSVNATLDLWAVQKAPPGYYMLFVFNAAGTPSIAKILSIQ
jgi:hypothetical protein